MHVGMAAIFQNPDRRAQRRRRLCATSCGSRSLAEPLGFDSLWGVEHHFTDYTMCPDVLQFLTYMAGRTKRVKLGSMVVVLPWHDPMRVAEEISMLDHMSSGRLILGIGRGAGRVEFDGFRRRRWTSRASASSKSARDGPGRARAAATASTTASTIKQPRARHPPEAGKTLQGPHLRGGGLARVGRRSWRSSASAS